MVVPESEPAARTASSDVTEWMNFIRSGRFSNLQRHLDKGIDAAQKAREESFSQLAPTRRKPEPETFHGALDMFQWPTTLGGTPVTS
jgi:hypothetical protein